MTSILLGNIGFVFEFIFSLSSYGLSLFTFSLSYLGLSLGGLMSCKEWRDDYLAQSDHYPALLERARTEALREQEATKDMCMAECWVECMEQARAEALFEMRPVATPEDEDEDDCRDDQYPNPYNAARRESWCGRFGGVYANFIYTPHLTGAQRPSGWCIYKLLYFTAVCIYTTKSSTPATPLFILGPNPVVVYIRAADWRLKKYVNFEGRHS